MCSQVTSRILFPSVDGVFGAMMSVSLTNEVNRFRKLVIDFLNCSNLQGPVTFTLDTRKFEYIDMPSSNKKLGRKAAASSTSETEGIKTPP